MTEIKFIMDDGRKWYKLNGTDYGTGYEFNNDEFGLCDDGVIIDCDGYPLTDGSNVLAAVRRAIVNN